jgi:hypothetical protein
MPKVVIFSSHSHVLPFVFTEHLVADAIYKNGGTPIFLRPNYCTCSSINRYRKTKNKYSECLQCSVNQAFLKENNPEYQYQVLDDFISIKDFSVLSDSIFNATPPGLLDYIYERINVGRLALHDIILKYKISNLDFTNYSLAFEEYKNLIFQCVFFLSKFKSYLSQNEDISALVVYNSHYTLNRSICAFAELCGISTYSLHCGPSLAHVWDTLIITQKNNFEYIEKSRINWLNGYSRYVLDSEQVSRTADHLLELFKGQAAHAYSAPVGTNGVDDLFKKSDKAFSKFILIATSSMDEVLSLQESGIYNFDKNSLFKSQIDWLNFLINKARDHSDICFIVRVHPREFPNKREGVKSQNAEKLEKLFQSLPENVIINWPADNISIYEIIPKVDLVLTFWSSAGLEASLFGCPIIVPQNPICAYTAIANKVSQTTEQYWNDILEGLDEPWGIERVIKTFRWMWLNHFGGTISLESSERRVPTMFNKFHDLKNWILKKINRKKLGFLINTSIAYHGKGWKISQRKTNVKGESLIVKQILNHQNILDDFSCMHYPKSVEKTEQITLLKEETSEVLSALSKIFEKLGRPKKWLD